MYLLSFALSRTKSVFVASERYFNSLKFLKSMFLLKILVNLLFGLGALFSYVVSIYYIISVYGLETILFSFLPYILFGVILSVFLLNKERRFFLKLLWFFILFPVTLLSEYGINTLILVVFISLFNFMERSHRIRIVKSVAIFTEQFTPKQKYLDRLKNKDKFKQYQGSFSRLEYIDLSKFILITEEVITLKSHKLGINQTKRIMTFKIKGLLGKTTVIDDMTTVPQSKIRFKGVR